MTQTRSESEYRVTAKKNEPSLSPSHSLIPEGHTRQLLWGEAQGRGVEEVLGHDLARAGQGGQLTCGQQLLHPNREKSYTEKTIKEMEILGRNKKVADVSPNARRRPAYSRSATGYGTTSGWDNTTLHCTALHCTALHCTTLHCTALHWPGCMVPRLGCR